MNSRPLQAVPVSRRQFLPRLAVLALATPAIGSRSRAAEARSDPAPTFRAAIVGHTGRGDYGHELDRAFEGLSAVQVVAVADPVERGRAAAARRCGALRQYADYREMLAKEQPQLVVVAPRWTEEHHAMGLAALQGGAHVLLEKPITPTLAEADDLLAEAARRKLRIAVAHQMRLSPSITHLRQRLAEGLIGELAQIRAWGKQDRRAGGEDLLVLGTHIFDLMRLLAGDPLWCTARVLQRGRDLRVDDGHQATEAIGLVGGDTIDAQFAFAGGVMAFFTSRGDLRETTAHWGVELIGSQGIVRILLDIDPTVYVLRAGRWAPGGKTDHWERLAGDPALSAPPSQRGFGAANRRVVADWLEAIGADREPACSGREAMKALEMIMAVYHAALGGRRVPFPLTERRHPLRSAGATGPG